jgi:MOSC domain-containing protein YiiM
MVSSLLTGSVEGLQVGKPVVHVWQNKEWTSGIAKAPAEGKVYLGVEGFEGDGQADLVNHGGRDKAVCVYSLEHYPYWKEALGSPMNPSAFGENITAAGMTEDAVYIGDIFRAGDAVVQISQPRQPCYKLGYKYGRTDMPLLVQNSGYTGYYFRVLEEGLVAKGDPIILLERSAYGITVSDANRVMYQERTNRQAMEQMLAIPELSSSWRQTFTKRIGEL